MLSVEAHRCAVYQSESGYYVMFFQPYVEAVPGSLFIVSSTLDPSARGVNDHLIQLVKEEAQVRGIAYIEGIHDPALKPASP